MVSCPKSRAHVWWALPAQVLATTILPAASDHVLWYDQPAAAWDDALPIGNGRLGAMVYGGPVNEHLALNEDSLWYGGPRDRNNPDARRQLPTIRSLLKSGDVSAAERLAMMAMTGLPETQRHYEPFADLRLMMDHGEQVSDYRRELDLGRAVVTVSYAVGNTHFTRDYLATAPDQVVAIRLRCDQSGGLSFRARLTRQGEGQRYSHYLNASGKDGNNGTYIAGTTGDGGVSYRGDLRVKSRGGTVQVIGDHVVVEGANEAVVLVGGATSFYSADPESTLRGQMDRASILNFEILMARHIDDYRRFFDRVSLDLGGETYADVPTNERLARFAEGAEDPRLIGLYFDFGRYLLIACSRPGTQPANLQGIWNHKWLPPWDSKYTININTEMNYWPAEVCNLAELQEPLFALLERMREPGRQTARVMYGARGFCAHHNTDIWGDTAPQDLYPPATIWPMGAAWLATHLWEHHLFDPGNKDFLRRAYPLLKEASQFFFDYLTDDGTGHVVTGPSVSPENTYITANGERGHLCLGPTMDTEIVEYLLRASAEAARQLGVDADFQQQAESVRERLHPLKIGRDGTLMEWAQDYEEVDPGHRHISHLWALMPGDAISPRSTPDLAKAARATLERRLANGGGATGWSRAWIINFWARLLDGEQAYANLRALLSNSTLPNLLDNHPPFQIDGNFGGTAGVAEMLVQSRPGEIELLPALPAAWPAGSFSGLRARGGFEVDATWESGSIRSVTMRSAAGGKTVLRVGEMEKTVEVPPGIALRLGPDLEPVSPGAPSGQKPQK